MSFLTCSFAEHTHVFCQFFILFYLNGYCKLFRLQSLKTANPCDREVSVCSIFV